MPLERRDRAASQIALARCPVPRPRRGLGRSGPGPPRQWRCRGLRGSAIVEPGDGDDPAPHTELEAAPRAAAESKARASRRLLARMLASPVGRAAGGGVAAATRGAEGGIEACEGGPARGDAVCREGGTEC